MRIHARAAATALLIATIGAPGVGAAAAGPGMPATVHPAGGIASAQAWFVMTVPGSGASHGPASPFARALGGNTLVDRTGEGAWTIVWEIAPTGSPVNGGTVQVSPLGSAPAQCWVESWYRTSAKVEAKVRCRDATGPYVDVPFIAMWTMHPSPYATYEGKSSGYAWMNLPSSSGTPNAGYQATSGGGAVTSTQTGEGAYTVTMPGVQAAEHVVVTSKDTDGVCRPAGWGADGAALEVRVACGDLDGDPADSQFTIFAGRNVSMGGVSNGWSAYAVVRKPKLATYRVAAADGFNNADRPITVRRVARGRWTVRFAAMPAGGAAVVSPLGGRATCQVGSLPRTGKDLRIGVRCFSPGRAPVDSRFIVSWGK